MLIQFEIRKLKRARPVLSYPVLDRRHFPCRGMLYSILVHQIIFLGLLLLPLFMAVKNPSPRLELLGTINLRKSADVLYLPVIPRAASEPVAEDQFSKPVPNRKGITYPGPQQIVSDFQDPTNFIQTVVQPEIKNPPILKPPLLLPNVLQLANAAPIPKIDVPLPPIKAPTSLDPASPEPAVKPIQPILPVKPETAPTVESPKFVIPETSLPKPAQRLLALTPMPALPVQPPIVPAGEARGNFAISPEPNPGTADENNSGKSEKGAGVNSKPEVKSVLSGINVTGGNSPGRGPSPVADPFAGITILGGSASVGTISTPSTPGIVSIGSPRSVDSSYDGITVISTASSGGGLSHSEVFSNETIYTVYLDMKRPADAAPSWVFEFGVPPLSDRGKSAAQIQQGIILPFPISKEQPAFPVESVRRYLRQRIIVYAIIQTDGKMQQISVKETPDPALNEAVVTALHKWIFRPGQVDGESVPVKVLLGVPVYE